MLLVLNDEANDSGINETQIREKSNPCQKKKKSNPLEYKFLIPTGPN
jgi:hypothetical protein